MSTRWTQEQYDAYVAKSVAAGLLNAQPKPPLRQALVSPGQGEGQGKGRVVVRVTRKACRLLDFDNMGGSVKALVDQLRYCGAIANDDPQTIQGEVAQEKVRHKSEEGTQVELIWP